MARQQFGGIANLTLAGQENQDVATSRDSAFVDCIDNGVLDVAFLVFSHVGVTHRSVTHFHRIQAAGYLDHRRSAAGRFEMPREAIGVDGGRGDDDLEIRPALQQLLEIAQQKVDVERALMRLVDDEGVVGPEVRIALGLGQEDAVGHQLDVGVAADLLVEADLVADRRSELGAQLLRDACGGSPRGDAARLCVADQPGDAAPELKAYLGQLGGLAGAGFAADDNHLVGTDGRGDVGAPGRNRQVFRIGDHRQARDARGLLRGGK